MTVKKVLKAIEPYCDRIVLGKHYKAYVKGTNKVIVFAASPSDTHYHTQIYREFRKVGVIIPELNNGKKVFLNRAIIPTGIHSKT